MRLRTLGLVFVPTLILGCAQMRQNLRGQELSYRGAWFCPQAGCGDDQMVRSSSGTRDGAVEVATVKLQPRAAMAFTAESAFETLDATVTDCKGKSVELPEGALLRAGRHKIGNSDARESWMVVLDKTALRGKLKLGKKACARWTVDVTATWTDGATFSSRAAIKAEK